MSSLAAQSPTPAPPAPRHHRLDAEFHFCHSALACGRALAAQGELESASRDVWLIEDATAAIEQALARIQDPDPLQRYQAQLAHVMKQLAELKQYLSIPSSVH
jgi:hypothetical protein